MPPPFKKKMISTATPHSTLRIVRTTIGTRLSTLRLNIRAIALRPPKGVAEHQDHARDQHFLALVEGHDCAQRRERHGAQAEVVHHHHHRAEPVELAVRVARCFADRDLFEPERREVADQVDDDERRRPLPVVGLAERAHQQRRDERAHREVRDAHDDLHENVGGGALAGYVASYGRHLLDILDRGRVTIPTIGRSEGDL